MEGFDGHPGTARLATVLSQRMKRENESPLMLDFGEIQGNYSLVTNTFPVSIPKGDYSICRAINGYVLATLESGQEVSTPKLKPGDRVLIAWVQSEAVVIDIIESSERG